MEEIKTLVQKALTNCLFDYSAPLPEKRDYLLYFIEDGMEIGIASQGSIIEITGKTGSRKSTIMKMFVASCFRPDGIYHNILSKVDGTVLWFDTEMAGDDFAYFQRDVYHQSQIDETCNKYFAINLDSFESSQEKLQIVDDILSNSNLEDGSGYFQDLQVVILDGIADLVTDTNNESENRQVMQKIKRWVNDTNCVFITVLHTDKKGQNSRGTLGTLLDQKSTAAVIMDMPEVGGPTTARCRKIRNSRAFRSFEISHDEFNRIVVNDTVELTLQDFMLVSSAVQNSLDLLY